MSGRPFDLAVFCLGLGAGPKERNILRQDLVRGLKDYFEAAYGYDRYGAETIFQIPERLAEPYVYGFAMSRILHDRRLPESVKSGAAEWGLEAVAYGEDGGMPYAFYAGLCYLLSYSRLSVADLRYGLVVSAGEYLPFRGMDRPAMRTFFRLLLEYEDLPPDERLFWGHSLIARHQDAPGVTDLINTLLGSERFEVDHRIELCQAWLNFRQPHLAPEAPLPDGSARSIFVAEHMPFWVAHSPSWPSETMIRMALVWLARLGIDPLALAETYISFRDTHAEQIHLAIADILAEHRATISDERLRDLIEQGLTLHRSVPTRRAFYRLGNTIFGDAYLQRAAGDSASSVRQWATRQLQRPS